MSKRDEIDHAALRAIRRFLNPVPFGRRARMLLWLIAVLVFLNTILLVLNLFVPH